MNKTPYYNLPLYEPTDSPNLLDGYNKAMLALDSDLHQMQNNNDLLTLRVKTLEKKVVELSESEVSE